ncbi:hypothetical protein [Thermofilum pendens]|uniref:NurA domain-containing protein n=1 Tax=Thermofilum pendens (strain DSM 2475 / Hrk 5) TaxID=368408 RepID=A1RWA7_THEPD|nr:hypothetical protein [Thermofilum pendens]ABL77487.1 hypothetical protein Tpen_0077 [Thermofilum pendens Hrk 5]
MKVIYVKDPVKAPPSPIAIVEEPEVLKAYLDDDLNPVRCFDEEGFEKPCPEIKVSREDTVFMGGVVSEVLASQYNCSYIDDRVVRLNPSFNPENAKSYLEVAKNPPGSEEIAKDTVLIVVPGSLISRKSMASAVAGLLERGEIRVKAVIDFDAGLNYRVAKIDEWDVLSRYDYWWEVPWNYVVASGRNLRRFVELLTERPVEKPPKKLQVKNYVSLDDFLQSFLEWFGRASSASEKRREVRRFVAFVDENLFEAEGGYRAAVLVKNTRRSVVARWYFTRKFELRAFDGFPPEAVRDVDMEAVLGNVPRESQARIPSHLAAFFVRQAVLSPVRIEDFLAVKAHRWVEVAYL